MKILKYFYNNDNLKIIKKMIITIKFHTKLASIKIIIKIEFVKDENVYSYIINISTQ